MEWVKTSERRPSTGDEVEYSNDGINAEGEFISTDFKDKIL